MIRINLLGRNRPKAARTAVPIEATLQYVLLVIALVAVVGILYGHYTLMDRENNKYLADIQKQTGEKARLEQLKQQVDNFEKQKAVLQQRIAVIEQLQRNRTGGQELLDAVANTVGRTDTLWLTSIDRKGDSLTITGSAGSLNAVANYITQLKRSGYFQQVEIKESHQDSTNKAVEIFNFTLTATFGLPPADNALAAASQSASSAPVAAAPARKPGKISGGAMAISFREYPWYLQALVFFALALILVGAGEYVPMSPVAAMRATLDENQTKDSALIREVGELQVYERRNAEFKLEMAALEKQLDTLKTIVPEDKELDEFMHLLQGAASASGVQVRSLAAQAVVPKDYHYELPFEITVDGPFYSIEDFFARLSRLSRIINVGDMSFSSIDGKGAAFPLRPGTTVSGKCVVITFFSKPGEAAPSPAVKNQPARH